MKLSSWCQVEIQWARYYHIPMFDISVATKNLISKKALILYNIIILCEYAVLVRILPLYQGSTHQLCLSLTLAFSDNKLSCRHQHCMCSLLNFYRNS